MKSLAYKAIAAAAFSVFAINSAQASNADLTVDGEVITTSCVINSEKSLTKTMTLVGVPTTSLAKEGQIAGPRNSETFNLTGCLGEKVKVTFDNRENFAGKYLKNVAVAANGKDPATNVAIRLTDKNFAEIDLATEGFDLALNNGAADFVIGAEYIAVGGAATTGLVQGMLKMTLIHD